MEQTLVDLQDHIRDVKCGGAFGDEMPPDSWDKVRKLIAAIRKVVLQ